MSALVVMIRTPRRSWYDELFSTTLWGDGLAYDRVRDVRFVALRVGLAHFRVIVTVAFVLASSRRFWVVTIVGTNVVDDGGVCVVVLCAVVLFLVVVLVLFYNRPLCFAYLFEVERVN